MRHFMGNVECFELFDMPAIDCPGFARIEKGEKDTALYTFNLVHRLGPLRSQTSPLNLAKDSLALEILKAISSMVFATRDKVLLR